jgi:hypothetical protein
MDPFNPAIPPVPSQPDGDSAADERKADERRAEVAHQFRAAMVRNAEVQSTVPSGATAANATRHVPSRLNTANAAGAPLSPAMLRLQAQGFPIPSPQAEPPPPVETVEPEQRDSQMPFEAETGESVKAGEVPGAFGNGPAATNEANLNKPFIFAVKRDDDDRGVIEDLQNPTRKVDLSDGFAASVSDNVQVARDQQGSTDEVDLQHTFIPPGKGDEQAAIEDRQSAAGTGGLSNKSIVPRLDRAGGRAEIALERGKASSAPDPGDVAGRPTASFAQQQLSAGGIVDSPTASLSPALLQQLVEFAAVQQNKDGFYEFQLGLAQDVLGGLQIRLAAYGNRRVGLKVKSGRGRSLDIGEQEIAGLIAALQKRGVDVVDVDMG